MSTTPEQPEDGRDTEPDLAVAVAARADERVDRCGDASFPASDPPNWWSGV